MGKNTGSLSLEALILLALTALAASFGHIQIQKAKTAAQIQDAKIMITGLYKKYAVLSLDRKLIHRIVFDYGDKTIDVYDHADKKTEHADLPADIRYATVYGGAIPASFSAKITEDGNITPIFSIYLFDRKNLARYRISLYGFDVLKHLRIYVYKNRGDPTATYENIVSFHDKFSEDSKHWERE